MDRDLSRTLHALTSRLDRAADQILRAEGGLSYSRFLTLFMIGSLGADTQRVLADRLGVSEPSVSRMTRLLAEGGLLDVTADPAGGNRNRLTLTRAGDALVTRWGGVLEARFATIVTEAGISYALYAEQTRRVLAGVTATDDTQTNSPTGR